MQVSNQILTSCQLHKVTSGWNPGHKEEVRYVFTKQTNKKEQDEKEEAKNGGLPCDISLCICADHKLKVFRTACHMISLLHSTAHSSAPETHRWRISSGNTTATAQDSNKVNRQWLWPSTHTQSAQENWLASSLVKASNFIILKTSAALLGEIMRNWMCRGRGTQPKKTLT